MTLTLCLLFAIATAVESNERPIVGHPTVVDGDSLDYRNRRVRLWGIDAPELSQQCRRGKTSWDCGRQARAALAAHIEGLQVLCTTVDVDTHERAVSRCTLGNENLNEWMVREGWALDYRRYSDGAFAAAEAQAREARRGIWSGTFEKPERYRRR